MIRNGSAFILALIAGHSAIKEIMKTYIYSNELNGEPWNKLFEYYHIRILSNTEQLRQLTFLLLTA